MDLLTNSLKHRGHLKIPVQTPNADGGFDQTYETIKSFWLELKHENAYLRAVRGENTGEGIIQIARARFQVFETLGAAFTKGFSFGFDMIADINPIKGNYFLFVDGSRSTRGRLFKIAGIAQDEKYRMWMDMQLEEIEEQGTGAPA